MGIIVTLADAASNIVTSAADTMEGLYLAFGNKFRPLTALNRAERKREILNPTEAELAQTKATLSEADYKRCKELQEAFLNFNPYVQPGDTPKIAAELSKDAFAFAAELVERYGETPKVLLAIENLVYFGIETQKNVERWYEEAGLKVRENAAKAMLAANSGKQAGIVQMGSIAGPTAQSAQTELHYAAPNPKPIPQS